MSKIKIKQNAFEGLDYNESVNFYFEKKKEYNEQKELKMKNLLSEKSDISLKKQKYENTSFNCSNCERPVNMIFEQTETKFVVKCGDKNNPCNINNTISKKKRNSFK